MSDLSFTVLASNIVPVEEERSNNSETWPFWMSNGFGGWSATGEPVTRNSALTVPSIYSAVSMISADISKLPLNLVKIDDNREKEVYKSHPAQYLVYGQANEEMTARQFWRQMIGDALIYNNSYAFIERGGDGRPRGLLPLLPDRTHPWRPPATGELVYRSSFDGYYEYLDPYDVLHIRGLMLTNSQAYPVEFLKYARDAIALATSAQEFESAFFKNGMRATGVLELPDNMPKTSADNLANSFRQKYESRASWYKALILREGAKFQTIADQTMKDSETHVLREDQVREIARLFKLPPSRLGLPDSVSYNSRAADNRQYYESALQPWMDMIVDECWFKLLLPGERRQQTYKFVYDVSSLLELDLNQRYAAYATGIQNKFLLPSEVREKEDLPVIDGIDDSILNPQPMLPFGQEDDGQEEDDEPSQEDLERAYGRNYARDKWLSERRHKYTREQLRDKLTAIAPKRGWKDLTSLRGISHCVAKYRKSFPENGKVLSTSK